MFCHGGRHMSCKPDVVAVPSLSLGSQSQPGAHLGCLRHLACPLAFRAQQHMQRQSADGLYNVLYLHAEQDWVRQCARWELASPGEQLQPWRFAPCPC